MDNARIKLLVERNVQALVAINGGPKTKTDEQFVADMTELAVGMLQAFTDIAWHLGEIVDRLDRMRP